MTVTVAFKNEKKVNTFISATTFAAFFHVVSLSFSTCEVDVCKHGSDKTIESTVVTTLIPHVYSPINKPVTTYTISKNIPKQLKETNAMDSFKNQCHIDQSAIVTESVNQVLDFEREEPRIEAKPIKMSVKTNFVSRVAFAMNDERMDLMHFEREEPKVFNNIIRKNIPVKIKKNMENGSELS